MFCRLEFFAKSFSGFVPKVWSVNSVGRTPSSWSRCQTGPAPPEGLGAPLFNTVASTVAVVSISPPLKPNGVVSIYRLFSNDTRGTDVVVSIVSTFSVLLFPVVFSSFDNFVFTSCYCWSQTAFLSWPPTVSCSAMHCPVCELKLSSDFTLPIYSFQCTWLCVYLIQPVCPIGACMAFHFHSLTPAILLAWLWPWHQEVPRASLCLLDSLLLIFCWTLLNHMLPNDSRCCPLLVFSTYFYFFGFKKSYTNKWLQQKGEVAVLVSSFRTGHWFLCQNFQASLAELRKAS